MNEPIELHCPYCSESFTIGVDSHFVTDEDLIENLKRSGARAVIHVGAPTRKPDLAQHRALDAEQRAANLRKIEAVMMDLAQGEQRRWYCDRCKNTNDYPREWPRGLKKETHREIPTPKCDVCGKDVERDTGYTLSTSEVTEDRNYWAFVFRNYPAHVQAIGDDGKRLLPFVIERSGDPGAWLVCQDCISMFAVEKTKARQLCQEQWTETGSLAARHLGPGQWESSLVAATEGWRAAFGKEPKADRDDSAIPAAMAIYATTTAKWKKGLSTESSLVVIGGSTNIRSQAAAERQKSRWQFWK
jgi:hypothetical protein